MTDFPVARFFFRVTIDGAVMAFHEVTGLTQEAEMLEYRHGLDKEFVTMKRAGMMKTGTISLKKGVFSKDDTYVTWLANIWDRKYGPTGEPIKDFQIELLDESETTVITWTVADAVPLKVVAPDLKSDANEVAIESIEFAHRGIKSKI